jgi:hypothetical protein
MLHRLSILSAASLAVCATAAYAGPAPVNPITSQGDTLVTLVRSGGGGGHMGGGGGHMGGGGRMGGGSFGHMGGSNFGGRGHMVGGPAHFAGRARHGGPFHGVRHHRGHRVGSVFIWGYDPGWWDCYYSYRYDGWLCPDY